MTFCSTIYSDWEPWLTGVGIAFITGGTLGSSGMPNDVFVITTSINTPLLGGIICPFSSLCLPDVYIAHVFLVMYFSLCFKV